MLPSTIVTNGITFTKISEDSTNGSVYKDLTGDAVYPSYLTVNHQTPKVGSKQGTIRHLLSVKLPMLDAASQLTGAYATCNCTVTHPLHADPSSIVGTALGCVLGSMATVTNFTANSNLKDGFLQSQY